VKRLALASALTLAACAPTVDDVAVTGEVERPQPERVRIAAIDGGPVVFPTTTTAPPPAPTTPTATVPTTAPPAPATTAAPVAREAGE
jgi:hypothetical protein